MSRVCVKNLKKNTTEKDLRDHFGSRGEITDVRVVKTKTGKSRQFGFIGFRTEQQAKECQQYFNNSFLKSAKIVVEMAAKIGDPALPVKKVPNALNTSSPKPNLNKEKNIGKIDNAAALPDDVDKTKSEFMSVMKSRSQNKFWANDDSAPTSAGAPRGSAPSKGSDDMIQSSGESESDDGLSESDDNGVILDSDVEEAAGSSIKKTSTPSIASDLAYLKSKVKHVTEDSSDEGDGIGIDDGDDGDGMSEDGAAEGGEGSPGEDPGVEDDIDESRLFIRNLPFSCSEEELSELFQTYGPLTQVHLPLADTGDGRGKGFGFVQFMIPEHALNARNALDGSSFQGRLLHVIQAKRTVEIDQSEKAAAFGKKLSAYQLKKEEQRRKLAAMKEGWNASHIRSDAVIEATAERYGVSRSDLMNTSQASGGELAVRLALGETQILQENKEYFQSHGVDISALESATSGNKTTKRSGTTILVKNLPYDLVESELEDMFSKFGTISAFLIPSSKTVALVDFTEPVHARAAFKGLAYRRYHHTPLYLEWAPLNVVPRVAPAPDGQKKSEVKGAEPSKEIAPVDSSDSFGTIFVKNLSFSTTESMLRDHLARFGLIDSVRAISLPKKSKGDAQLSMGFGFIEFRSAQLGAVAMSRLSGSSLDGRILELKPSDKRISTAKIGGEDKAKESSKLIVRNVAFQASQNEIRELFSAFGSVKRVRIPKKMGGQHRGFAFVDFSSSKEAAAAKQSLANTHLYGRHLVIEWASEEETSVEALRKRSQMDMSAIHSQHQSKRLKANGDIFVEGEGDMESL